MKSKAKHQAQGNGLIKFIPIHIRKSTERPLLEQKPQSAMANYGDLPPMKGCEYWCPCSVCKRLEDVKYAIPSHHQ